MLQLSPFKHWSNEDRIEEIFNCRTACCNSDSSAEDIQSALAILTMIELCPGSSEAAIDLANACKFEINLRIDHQKGLDIDRESKMIKSIEILSGRPLKVECDLCPCGWANAKYHVEQTDDNVGGWHNICADCKPMVLQNGYQIYSLKAQTGINCE
ncbi:hypothetical protein AB6D11_00375 [Vibrio splendidus]